MSAEIRALVLRETDGNVTAAIEQLSEDNLPDGDVTVDVAYSTLNYKDAMVIKGIGRLVRNYPHVPGIDFAGTVRQSSHPKYSAGDDVILTGWRVGEAHWGGYGERARVKGDWLVPMPPGLDTAKSMTIGTAGFTSMLAAEELRIQGVTPDAGPIVVTGATGGVGSVAVVILAKRGFEVHAVTGKIDAEGYLRQLGAKQIITRNELEDAEQKPLLTERWAGCVDTVGGRSLTSVLAQLKYHGCVAACGLAGGPALKSTVIPFLLRGVKLVGIDSVMCPFERRAAAWQAIANEVSKDHLDEMVNVIGLGDLPRCADDILAGRVKGRLVVDLAK